MLSLIREKNVLFVLAVGNTYRGPSLWYPDSPRWESIGYDLELEYSFDYHMQLFDTDKVILASVTASERVDGEIVCIARCVCSEMR